MTPHLLIGNVNYSSWSLRAWLALRWSGLGFTESAVELDQDGYGQPGGIAALAALSPSGKVPALRLGAQVVWDSLAIAEWAADQAAALAGREVLRPDDPLDRALMRAAVAEMHAGFSAMRAELPMNIRRRCRAHGLSAAARADLARVDRLWQALRDRHGTDGPWLMGRRSLADAAWLPVATRLRTYDAWPSAQARTTGERLLADDDFRAWEQRVLSEAPRPFQRAPLDALYAGTDH